MHRVRFAILFAAILFAALAAPTLLAARAEAAPQLLGLVASNGVPTPLQCKGGVCSGFFSSFCLQQYRPAPLIYTEYRLAPSGGLTLLVTRADATELLLPAEGLVTIHSEIDFSSVTMSIPEARLKAWGAVSAAIEVAPLTSILPVPVAGDASPQGAEEIALATGKLRRLAQKSFEESGEARDEARLATLLVNSLPAEEPKTAAGRAAVWNKTLALAASRPLDPAAVANASKMYSACGVTADMNADLDLKLCLQLRQTDLMSRFNRDFWDSTGGS
jgi:hypothetical protein